MDNEAEGEKEFGEEFGVSEQSRFGPAKKDKTITSSTTSPAGLRLQKAERNLAVANNPAAQFGRSFFLGFSSR